MKSFYLTQGEILFWHDEALLLTAKRKDKLYICMALYKGDCEGYERPYLIVEVDFITLENFKSGKLDLLDLYKNPYHKRWFLGEFKTKIRCTLITKTFKNLKKEWLPKKGFICYE